MKICISKDAYNTKEEAVAAVNIAKRNEYREKYNKKLSAIKWIEIDNITPFDFYNLILSGYSWNPGLYIKKIEKEVMENQNKGKGAVVFKKVNGQSVARNPFPKFHQHLYNGFLKECWWDGSYCMFADIDNTKANSIEEYCSYIPNDILPTFGFYSPSDKPDARRFKLVWVFDYPISDAEWWKEISKYIHNGLNSIEPMKDNCGTTITQMSYGNKGGSGVYYGNTYDPYTKFIDLFHFLRTDEEKEAIKKRKKPDDIHIEDFTIIELKKELPYREVNLKYDEWIWRSEDRIYWNEGFSEYGITLGLCKTGYCELYNNWGNKITDGNKRRKKLYERMCLRRILKPEAGPDEILLNAYRDREEFIDNSDGVVSVDNLIRNVRTAFTYTIDELITIFGPTIEKLKGLYAKRVYVYKSGKKAPKLTQSKRNQLEELYIRYLISCIYDPKLSDKENIENFNKAMEENDFKFRIKDRKLLWKYREVNEINNKYDRDAFILDKHKEGLSLSQIIDELMDNGFKSMSKQGVKNIIDKYKNDPNPPTLTKPEPTQELVWIDNFAPLNDKDNFIYPEWWGNM